MGDILSTLFTTGHYETPMTNSNTIRINKSFYDDDMLIKENEEICI